MNGWLWLALVLLLLVLLLASRLKARAEYDEDGFRITVRFGLLTIFRYPGRTGTKTEKEPKKPKKKKEKPAKGKKGGKLTDIQEVFSIIADTLGKLKRKLRVDELTLLYCSAARDPFAAAMAFGGASAAVGLILEPLERSFRIRKRDIRTAVSFTETEPTVVLKLSLSLSVFGLLSILLFAGLRYLKIMWKQKKLTGHPQDGHRYNNTEG